MELQTFITDPKDDQKDDIVIGSARFHYLFLITTLTLITLILSIISASFGLAKGLKTGVAGIFKPGGVLDGFHSFPFYTICAGRGQMFFKHKCLIFHRGVRVPMWSFLIGKQKLKNFYLNSSLLLLPFIESNATQCS